MTLLTHPGISQRPVRPTRRAGGLARRDIPVFLGFATRGPAMEPVRIESLRQFSGVFGEPFEASHLFHAVKGFFETGGSAAYVLRVVGAGAATADVTIDAEGAIWRISAQTPVASLAPLREGEVPLQWQDHLIRSYGQTIPDVGGWGNALSLRIWHEADRARGIDGSDPISAARKSFLCFDLDGLAAGGLVVVHQGTERQRVLIAKIDPLRRIVTFDRALEAGFDLTAPMTLSHQELSAEVLLNGQRVEAYDHLSPAPEHARFFANVLNAQSRFLWITPPLGFDPLAVTTDSAGQVHHQYPNAGTYALTGGTDGLLSPTESDWRAALKAQSIVDEIALIAAPDLTRQAPVAPEQAGAPMPPEDLCHLPIALPKGNIAARVVDAETGAGLPGVRIEAAGEGVATLSGAEGKFLIENVPVGLVELRLSHDDYLPSNPLLQASVDQTSTSLSAPLDDIVAIRLMQRTDIPALDPETILTLQQEMCVPETVGSFRIAVLDPLTPTETPEALLTWAAGLAGLDRGFAVAPWIGISETGTEGVILQPPSGHICGAFAFAEQAQGVHRAPGNMVLRHAKSVPMAMSEAFQTDCHRARLNLITATHGRSIRLMGARSLSNDPAWTHVSVRRLFDALERTLLSRLTWAVFEPNSATTRHILKFAIESLLEGMRRRGMFAGDTPAAAYSVICDEDVNPPAGQARGELVAEIAIAPTQPYEFIRFSLSAQSDAIEVTERT